MEQAEALVDEMVSWTLDYLNHGPQYMGLQGHVSNAVSCPHGMVLAPFLFTPYIYMRVRVTYNAAHCHLQKLCDYLAVVGCCGESPLPLLPSDFTISITALKLLKYMQTDLPICYLHFIYKLLLLVVVGRGKRGGVLLHMLLLFEVFFNILLSFLMLL